MADLSSVMPFFDDKVQGTMNMIESGTAYHNPISNTVSNQNAMIDDLFNKIPQPDGMAGNPWTWDKYNRLTDSMSRLKIQNIDADSQVSSLMSNYTDKVQSVLQASNIENIRNNVESIDRCKSFLENYFGISSGALDSSIQAAGDALNSVYGMIEGGVQALADGADAVTNTISETAGKIWTQIQQETGLGKLVDGINAAFAGASSLTAIVNDPCVRQLAENTLSDDLKDTLGF